MRGRPRPQHRTHQPYEISERRSDSLVDERIVGIIDEVTQSVGHGTRSGDDDGHDDGSREPARGAGDDETDENIVDPDGSPDAG